jgi:diguanylate cyclase (GGDEF)-like protein
VRERPATSSPPATPWLAARLQLALDAVAHPDEVRGSGCLLVDRTSALRAVANAGPGAEALSLAEELCHEGPCHDALDGYGVEVPDVRAERRWPRLDVLIEATPLRSVVSLPVTYHGDPVGAIYAFTARDAELTRASYDALRAAVTEVEALVAEALAGSADTDDELISGLRAALRHRSLLREAAGHLPAGKDSLVQLQRISAATGLTPLEVATRFLEEGRALDPAELTTHAIERRTHREELARLALTDPLTGLPNRVLFFDRLDQALARTQRDGPAPGVIYVDLDRFKTINDSLGHDAGDQVLLAVADRLRSAIRLEDTACRLGGDEFAVLCEATDDASEAVRIGRRIVRAINAPLEVTGRTPGGDTTTGTVSMHASVGVAVARPGQRPTDVLREADQAMYNAKGRGGDRVQRYSPDLRGSGDRQALLEVSLRRLVGGTSGQLPSSLGELYLAYQPIVSLDTGQLVGLEALVRWPHPQLGAVSAAELIGTAEVTGLIVPLGAALLSEACRNTSPWVRGDGGSSIDLCVNVSALQLTDPSFLPLVDLALERSDFPPHRLCLELTESRLLEAAGAAQATLSRLAALGVKLAIDDFGTGYSSLAYLSHLPVHRLKIDRAFVAGLEGPQGWSVARAIIGLAQALDLETVGEGIETPAQAAQLRELDCQLAQGYLYGHPVPLEDLRGALEAGTMAGT